MKMIIQQEGQEDIVSENFIALTKVDGKIENGCFCAHGVITSDILKAAKYMVRITQKDPDKKDCTCPICTAEREGKDPLAALLADILGR